MPRSGFGSEMSAILGNLQFSRRAKRFPPADQAYDRQSGDYGCVLLALRNRKAGLRAQHQDLMVRIFDGQPSDVRETRLECHLSHAILSNNHAEPLTTGR